MQLQCPECKEMFDATDRLIGTPKEPKTCGKFECVMARQKKLRNERRLKEVEIRQNLAKQGLAKPMRKPRNPKGTNGTERFNQEQKFFNELTSVQFCNATGLKYHQLSRLIKEKLIDPRYFRILQSSNHKLLFDPEYVKIFDIEAIRKKERSLRRERSLNSYRHSELRELGVGTYKAKCPMCKGMYEIEIYGYIGTEPVYRFCEPCKKHIYKAGYDNMSSETYSCQVGA